MSEKTIHPMTITIVARHKCGQTITIHGDNWDDIHGVCPICDDEYDLTIESASEEADGDADPHESHARIADEVADMYQRVPITGRFTADYRAGAVEVARHIAKLIRESSE